MSDEQKSPTIRFDELEFRQATEKDGAAVFLRGQFLTHISTEMLMVMPERLQLVPPLMAITPQGNLPALGAEEIQTLLRTMGDALENGTDAPVPPEVLRRPLAAT